MSEQRGSPEYVDNADQIRYAELVEQYERLQRENAELRADESKRFWITEHRRVIARVGELEAKLAAAEADTKRLDWLEQRKYACIGINYHESQWVYQIETDGYAERGKTLRSALDSARGDKGE